MSINKIILLSLLLKLLIAQDPPTTYDELSCGDDEPEEPSDCTDYGTGSGMVCCWISNEAKTKGICRLVPDDTARDQGISGEKTFSSYSDVNKRYWNCGNKANFIYFNLAFILLLLFLL